MWVALVSVPSLVTFPVFVVNRIAMFPVADNFHIPLCAVHHNTHVNTVFDFGAIFTPVGTQTDWKTLANIITANLLGEVWVHLPIATEKKLVNYPAPAGSKAIQQTIPFGHHVSKSSVIKTLALSCFCVV